MHKNLSTVNEYRVIYHVTLNGHVWEDSRWLKTDNWNAAFFVQANLQLESRCRKIVIRCLENNLSVALCLYYESIQTWEVLHFKSRSPSPLLSLTAQQVTCLFFHCLELSEMGFYIYVPLFIDAWVNLFAKFLKIYMVLVSKSKLTCLFPTIWIFVLKLI
jgi:hypothetical protein